MKEELKENVGKKPHEKERRFLAKESLLCEGGDKCRRSRKESNFVVVKEIDNFLWRKMSGEGKRHLFRKDKPTAGWMDGQTDRRMKRER